MARGFGLAHVLLNLNFERDNLAMLKQYTVALTKVIWATDEQRAALEFITGMRVAEELDLTVTPMVTVSLRNDGEWV